jgi:hypothetical protein
MVAALLLFASGADAAPVPPAVRLARKLVKKAAESLMRAESPGEDAAAESRRAVHVLSQARDVLAKKRSPRPPEYVEEMENVRVLAYWIIRKTPVKDAKGLERLYLPKEGPDEASRALFEKADDYARRRGTESFVLAARYFEIADRYSETRVGREAKALYITHHDAALTGKPADIGRAPLDLPADDPDPDVGGTGGRRDDLLEELVDMLQIPDMTPEEKLDACRSFLRERPSDPLVREVAALMDIFAAADAEERAEATRDYLDLFPEGYFTKYLPKPEDEGAEDDDFDALVFELRSNSPPSEKERACRGFLRAHGGSARAEEVGALRKVFFAKSQDRRMTEWLYYRANFPAGVARAQAESMLRRSEPLLLVQIKQALVDDDEDRARSVGSVYLDLFPKGPAVAEIRQLFQVLQKPRGPARAWAAEQYIEKHRDGTFTAILRKVVVVWRRKNEEADYKVMREAFLASPLGAPGLLEARAAAIDEFLRANPTGAYAPEVRALRAIFALRGTKGRLNAARKYLDLYPRGGVVEAVREIESDLAGRHENELYEITISGLRDATKSMEAKLATLDEYLAEYPDGEHADEIRAAAQAIRDRAAEEVKAFAKLENLLTEVEDPAVGVRLCDEFAASFPGGANLDRVKERREVFQKSLLKRQEATDYRALSADLKDGSISRYELADRCIAFIREYREGKYLDNVRNAMAELAPHRLPRHAGVVRAAAFSNDSARLVTLDAHARTDGSGAWVWALPEGRLVARYAPRPGITAQSAAFVPEGDELWICEASGGLLSWSILGGEVVGRYRLGWGALRALGVSDDREVVVSASYRDSKARSWDAADWTLLEEDYRAPGGASAVAVDGAGELVAVGGRGGTVAVYEVGYPEPFWVAADVHTRQIDRLLFSPDGRYLVSVSGAGGLVCMWDADSGDDLWKAEEASTDAAFVGSDMVLTGPGLRRAADGLLVAELNGGGTVAASPDGRFAFTAGEGPGSGTVWYLPALVGR